MGVRVKVAVALGVKVVVGKGVHVGVADAAAVCVEISVEDGPRVAAAGEAGSVGEAVAQPLINPASKVNLTPDRISQRIGFMKDIIMVF